ncbi:P MRP subunit POP5 [Octopus vulgaris]|uniref:P MRP subunit POP5 n=2 Tax=Octopus TaxID=6643 RepID=A0AA36FNS3_OCTVU|nr:ribonuclease P/MRP protein subunit POP5 [Octopus sinensis]CAI9740513.1 P MRP subunit POP5 [Octopus vulgaris]
MRFKKRYLLYEIESCHQFYSNDILSAITEAVQTAYGDYGRAVIQKVTYVKYFDSNTNTIIIVVPRKHCLMVQSAVCFIKLIKNKEASLRSLHVGGTIKSTKKSLLAQRYQALPRAFLECKNKEEREKVQASIFESCSGKLESQIEASAYKHRKNTVKTTT